MESHEKLLKKKEVAEMFSCSLRIIDRLVARERLTRVKVMGAIRFRLSEVKALMGAPAL